MSLSRKGKITGTLLFVSMLLGVLYFSVISGEENAGKIDKILLTGNRILSREFYLKFSKLNDISAYKFLSLAVIKDRLEKHPYISRADVKFSGNHEVSVEITEKKFKAIVLSGSDQYLITEDFQLAPVMPFTRNIDLPVISNPSMITKHKRWEKFRNSETITAFRIIDAARLVNQDLCNGLSEINMRDGHDIVLSLRNFLFPIVIGRGDEVRKLIYLNSIWTKLDSNKNAAGNLISYIDLRFDKLVYVGMAGEDMDVNSETSGQQESSTVKNAGEKTEAENGNEAKGNKR